MQYGKWCAGRGDDGRSCEGGERRGRSRCVGATKAEGETADQGDDGRSCEGGERRGRSRCGGATKAEGETAGSS